MKNDYFFKASAFIIIFIFLVNLPCDLHAGNYFVSGSGSENNTEVKVGYKFKFGTEKSIEEKNSKIEKLKQEDTRGGGTAIALIILGACIVAAAVVLADKSDEIVDQVIDQSDEITDEIGNEIDEAESRYNGSN